MELRASEVDESPRCIACGYDLRSLSFWGDCPECGLAIERSIGSEPLARAHPDWLNRMARGTLLVGWAVGLASLIAPLMFAGAIVSFARTTGGAASFLLVAFVAIGVIALVAYGCAAVGGFLLSQPDPGRLPDREQPRVTLLLRCHASGVILVTIASFALAGLPLPALATQVVVGSASLAGVWLLSLLVIASLRRMAHIVARASENVLAKRLISASKGLLWAMTAFAVLYGLEHVFFWNLPPAAPAATTLMSNLRSGLICGGGIALLYVLIQLIVAMALAFQARRVCRHCLEVSKQLMTSPA